ncbi:hypothetical protein ABL78_6011 [Leptomonas seymouri]|uniref:Uncharacterized protein n=1 Tax=Leptomonas seymouri TaxID=5684 RepID=A0A0N1I2P9_LEPSE|nr:hypothetical protein ABL78_6011 [Leptomonas seymouri]|eukprot:KPI84944.1 hypothetical protein ABL78_6011 [Leptomonas seymouri]
MIRSLCRYTRVAPHGAVRVRACSGSTASRDCIAVLTSSPAHGAASYRCNGASFAARLRQSSVSSALVNSVRSLSYVTNASNFETEVLQSQQAICLVYYINNTKCSAYLKSAEKLVDAINAETSGLDAAEGTVTPASASPVEAAEAGLTIETKDGAVSGQHADDAAPHSPASSPPSPASVASPKRLWLKLCTINADENRNLASAFSVERAKLPITYFVMQGTMVDKAVGHIAEGRLQGILEKFLEHYQKEMNVDLLARRSKDGASGAFGSPLPTAATADLLCGTSTGYLQNKMMNALVGADMIQLPEEAQQLDGIRRSLQEAKKKAHVELQELHKQLGMDTRRLTDAEMHAHYFSSPQFHALGVLSGLEALFLARSHATLGDVARTSVEWARRAVQKDFEPIQSDRVLRRVMVLVDVNLLRGELRTAATLAAQDANRLASTLASMDTDGLKNEQYHMALRDMQSFTEGQRQYCQEMLSIVDEHVDSRTLDGSEFPSAVMDQLFEMLKANLKLCRVKLPTSAATTALQQGQGAADKVMEDLLDGKTLDTTPKQVLTSQARVPQIRTVITSLVQLYSTDPKAQAARSRLSSLMY